MSREPGPKEKALRAMREQAAEKPRPPVKQQAPALQPCPVCGVLPGFPCVSSTGKPRRDAHASRMDR